MITPDKLSALIVDDNDYARALTTTHLNNMGFGSVSDAPDAIRALELMQRETFDVLILDWYMPEINGAGMVRLMKLLKFDMPIVISTAYAMQDNLKRMMGMDLQHIVVKPASSEKLMQTIWDAIKDHRNKSSEDEVLI